MARADTAVHSGHCEDGTRQTLRETEAHVLGGGVRRTLQRLIRYLLWAHVGAPHSARVLSPVRGERGPWPATWCPGISLPWAPRLPSGSVSPARRRWCALRSLGSDDLSGDVAVPIQSQRFPNIDQVHASKGEACAHIPAENSGRGPRAGRARGVLCGGDWLCLRRGPGFSGKGHPCESGAVTTSCCYKVRAESVTGTDVGSRPPGGGMHGRSEPLPSPHGGCRG